MLWKLFTVSKDTKFTKLRCRATTTITFVPTNLIRLKRLSKACGYQTATSQQPQYEQQIKAVLMKMTKTEFLKHTGDISS